ncbi:MAG: response regulator transcription factor [bacterium]
MTAPRILVVDDEPMVREVVERYLAREGFGVTTAADGATALERWRAESPNLVVLDLMLPAISGMDICREIRLTSDTPIIMLTARGDEMDRIAGFENGADDYLAKPFSPRELVARVRAVLKRSFEPDELSMGIVESGAVTVHCEARKAWRAGKEVRLTGREFDLLRFLVCNPSRVFSRQELLARVWHFEWPGDESTVTVHVRRLRTKIEAEPDHPVHLKTVWGAGYRWDR